MNKEDFSNALNLAFPNSMVRYSPDFWNFVVELEGELWRLYINDRFVNKIENGKSVDEEIDQFKNSRCGDYLLTIDPRLTSHEAQDGNGLLISLPKIS